jgi:hypothetical protein
MKTLKTIIGVCLCHRVLHGVVAAGYAAGFAHVVGHEVVMAVGAFAYGVMALRG